MRYQGKIITWKDDQGFGFITPNSGGPQVFIHIKSLSNQRRRPVGNEIVTYELAVNGKGQPRAEKVAYIGDRTFNQQPVQRGVASLLLSVVFLGCVAVSVLAGKLPSLVLGLYLGVSAVAFVAYAIDKSAAQNNRWRTRESTLHMFSLAGGWPGALFAQRVFRHKSKKQSFQMMFWITVVINCSGLGWLLSHSGSSTLRSILGLP